MSNTRRLTVNVPTHLYEQCATAIDGVYLLNMSQLVLVAMSDLVKAKHSPPFSSSPLHPPTPNTPPIITPKGVIYTPPLEDPPKPKPKKKTGSAPEKYSGAFESFWDVYPRKVSKRNAWKAYFAASKVANAQDILDGVERSIKGRNWDGMEMRFIPHPSTWLSGRGWEDAFDKPAKRTAKAKPPMERPVDYTKHLKGESCSEWADASELIRDTIGAYDFNEWFGPVRGAIVRDTLIIGCPDKAHAEWLMQSYREEMSNAISIRFRVMSAEEFAGYVGAV